MLAVEAEEKKFPVTNIKAVAKRLPPSERDEAQGHSIPKRRRNNISMQKNKQTTLGKIDEDLYEFITLS